MKSVGLILVASVTAAALPVAKAQRSAQPVDIRRYDLLIRPDLDSRRLRPTATLDIANPSANQEFTLSLAAWYDTVVVRSRAGPATVARTGDVATIRVACATTHEKLGLSLAFGAYLGYKIGFVDGLFTTPR